MRPSRTSRSIQRYLFRLERLDWMQNLFLKAGVIKQTVPIESIVDKTVNADAAKIAGK